MRKCIGPLCLYISDNPAGSATWFVCIRLVFHTRYQVILIGQYAETYELSNSRSRDKPFWTRKGISRNCCLLKIGKNTANRIIKKFITTKCLSDLSRSGRPRKTTVRVNKIIKRKSTKDVKKTASEIAQEIRDENLANVSRSTVSRRLHDVGLFERVGVKKPLISKKNQKARLTFAQKYQHWTPKQWSKVLFFWRIKI